MDFKLDFDFYFVLIDFLFFAEAGYNRRHKATPCLSFDITLSNGSRFLFFYRTDFKFC